MLWCRNVKLCAPPVMLYQKCRHFLLAKEKPEEWHEPGFLQRRVLSACIAYYSLSADYSTTSADGKGCFILNKNALTDSGKKELLGISFGEQRS